MNKNNFKAWARAVLIRTIKTMAEAVLGLIGTNAAGITSVDWVGALSAAALAGVVCILTCIKGIPEVDNVTVHDLTTPK